MEISGCMELIVSVLGTFQREEIKKFVLEFLSIE